MLRLPLDHDLQGQQRAVEEDIWGSDDELLLHFVQHNAIEDVVMVVALFVFLRLFKELGILNFLKDLLSSLRVFDQIGVMP